MRALTIAIDGPSGAGKGTVARSLATALGYRHIDTGAMYRAVAWLAWHRGVSLEDEQAVADLASQSSLVQEAERVLIDGHDVTRAIRTPEMDRAAAAVARLRLVRAALVEHQRRMGAGGGVVMEGRDIGTVVFPEADLKIYLDASPEERARRRASDPARAGEAGEMATVAGALAERDQLDRTRTVSPLKTAPDAVVIDTTGLSVEEVVARAKTLAEEKQARRP